MFYNCSSLTRLNISSFNTSNVINMSYMFAESNRLVTIYAGPAWTTSGIAGQSNGGYLFENCESLVGGNGTTYDARNIDYDYARIDTVSTPGYFTSVNGLSVKATFVANGATSIGSTELMCNISGDSCTVTAPTITRNRFEIIGWSTNPNDTTGIAPGQPITLRDNATFMLLLKRIYLLRFIKILHTLKFQKMVVNQLLQV
jgi:surface protein